MKGAAMSIVRLDPGPRMSEAVVHGGVVYLAGQIASETAGQPIEAQTSEVLAAIDALLARAGSSKAKLLRCQIILADMADFAAMNGVWAGWVDPANPPARATIEAKLANPGWKIEIIATAAV
jgi:enamine deaminase RidA (YjgF/YER057c/UK114 family)